MASAAIFFVLGRNSEHVAIRASGVSVWRYLAPFVATSTLLGGLTILGVTPIVSVADEAARDLRQIIKGRDPNTARAGAPSWLTQADPNGTTMILARDLSDPAAGLRDAAFLRFDDDEQLVERLDAEQAMTPWDHLLAPVAGPLPALLVVVNPDGQLHFIVVWRRHGPWVQIMDSNSGRRWLTVADLLRKTFLHEMPVPAADWRAWAGGEEFHSQQTPRMHFVPLVPPDEAALLQSEHDRAAAAVGGN